MKLTSNSLRNGAPIDREFAAGDADGFAPDRNTHLAWDDVPAGTTVSSSKARCHRRGRRAAARA